MAHIALIAAKSDFATRFFESLRQSGAAHQFSWAEPGSLPAPDLPASAVFVYLPGPGDRDAMTPDLGEAQTVVSKLAVLEDQRFVLISSAMIYGTGPGRQVLVDENYSQPSFRGHISRQWQFLEDLAEKYLPKGAVRVVLRPCLVEHSPALPARILSREFVLSFPGHDPGVQLLRLTDLARAVLAAAGAGRPGTYNVAPDALVPRKRGIRYGGGMRLVIPRTLCRLFSRTETLDYVRYPWTVSGAKIQRETGFQAQHSSLAALMAWRKRADRLPDPEPCFDEFGMDQAYIRRLGRTVFAFLNRFYWRIEYKGLEHVPRTGCAILVGMHRGFVPLDGAMAVHIIVRKTGRAPRFLTHPMLFKFPFLFDFMSKLGGVIACQESARRVLESDGLLGVFPEGVQGAFTRYRNAYKLRSFGRDAFVKLSLRHRAPIIPFVTVGSAEIFPILAGIRFPWFRRYAGFPFIPITPTFPVLPLPLPAKWHTQFLPPIEVGQYSPDSADDPAVVRSISRQVRARMQEALDDMRSRRRSIFSGSIFGPSPGEKRSKPAAV
jgi:1-acyl-sn-glycerol-3-phosphate acyltransferase